MFQFITGTVSCLDRLYVVIDNMGMGYLINISEATYNCIRKEILHDIHKSVRVYTHVAVKDNGVVICGFMDTQELDIFRYLISVPGVGTKLAMNVVAGLSVHDLQAAIMSENIKLLTNIAGVGLKTAQRIIIELKGKLCKKVNTTNDNSGKHNVWEDALESLVHLGYTPKEAKQVILELKEKESDFTLYGVSVEDIISRSLRMHKANC
jgi:Holliday junction DNA helicase RuvA